MKNDIFLPKRKWAIVRSVNEQLDRFTKYVEEELSYINGKKFDEDFYRFCLLCLDIMKMKQLVEDRAKHMRKLEDKDVGIKKWKRVELLYYGKIRKIERRMNLKMNRWKFMRTNIHYDKMGCTCQLTMQCSSREYSGLQPSDSNPKFKFAINRGMYTLNIGMRIMDSVAQALEKPYASEFGVNLTSDETKKLLADVAKDLEAKRELKSKHKKLGSKKKGLAFSNRKVNKKAKMSFNRELNIK